jgi:murein DD-endopeptidase MepM/ murein hydrolase activator NlpD
MPNSIKGRAVAGDLRTRAAVLAAGVGVQAVLGSGASARATDVGHDIFAADTAVRLAEFARRQADQQERAAETALAQETALREARQREKELRASRKAKRRRASWSRPVARGYGLSAGFGSSGSRWAHRHTGQDFAVPSGTEVKAVHGGTVVKAGPCGAGDGAAYGNAIVIQHDARTYSQYAHLSAVLVRVGQRVETGQRIGRSGSTGNSSGPHLHFEMRSTPDYGSGVEPIGALRQHGVIV